MRTDLGNAERFVDKFGDDVRYVAGLGWHVWDGHRWIPDRDGGLARRMQQTVRAMYREAGEVDDGSERELLARWAAKSEAQPRLRSALELARTQAAVVVLPEALDRHPFLLNVENGTLDLRSGRLHAHRRADLLTRLCPVAFERDASDPRWDDFLARVTGGDLELASFIARAVGYSLTGDTSEKVLFFLHGPTDTGKTTLLEAVRSVTGDHARTTEFDSFLRRRGDAGPRNDLARLAGARVVTGAEVDEGKQLAEGLLKQLTGGDTVAARFLYREGFEFVPTFKVWLAANTRPAVSATDEAMWRRIIQIPFTQTIPGREQDKGFKDTFRNDHAMRAAVLAWAVRGCREWQRIGLAPPAAVLAYTDEYRAENDSVGRWLDACCEFAEGLVEKGGPLRASYDLWIRTSGEEPVDNKTWGQALRARALEHKKKRDGVEWHGVALTPHREGGRR